MLSGKYEGLGRSFGKLLVMQHGDLSSFPRTYAKKLSVMMPAHNPGTGEAETGEYLGLSDQPA